MKREIEQYFDRLWPLNRSLTGEGNRETLKILSELLDLTVTEIPAGTPCFDWIIPPEWNVKEAWIKDSSGNFIVDFKENNIHLLGYSIPFEGTLSLEELKQHLYSLPDHPDWIPYLTSYYKERWGFCLTHNLLSALQEDSYEVFIDSKLDADGSLTIGEAVLKGQTDREILLTTYICHPSLANNELSGPLAASFIYNELKKLPDLRYTYRFLFVPETIGSICYLSMHGNHLKGKLDAGYVITCIGDPGAFTYKKSRRGDTLSDRAAELVLSQSEKEYTIMDFFPSGSDERQFCSPGFNLPVGSLMRTRYGVYPEYHTSADNKDFISFEAIADSVKIYLEILKVIENNHNYINTMPFCEPQLSKRGLYPTLGSRKEYSDFIAAMMWILNLSDGNNDLIDVAFRSKIAVELLIEAKDKLLENKILVI